MSEKKIRAEKGHYIPRKVLGVHPHKDDFEGQASGTLCRWASANSDILLITTVVSADCAADERGRRWERKAATTLGYAVEFWELGHPTCKQYADKALTLHLCRRIREFKPEIVLCMPPYDQNPDHTMCFAATFNAVLKARCPFNTEFRSELLLDAEDPEEKRLMDETPPHHVKEIWIQPGTPTQNLCRVTPNHYEDVTDIWDKKISVFDIAPEDLNVGYLADIAEYSAARDGEVVGVQYAEAFLRIPIVDKMTLAEDYDAWRRKTKNKSYMAM